MISVDRSHLSVCTYVNVCVCLLHRHGFNQHFSVKKGDEGSNSPWNPLVCHDFRRKLPLQPCWNAGCSSPWEKTMEKHGDFIHPQSFDLPNTMEKWCHSGRLIQKEVSGPAIGDSTLKKPYPYAFKKQAAHGGFSFLVALDVQVYLASTWIDGSWRGMLAWLYQHSMWMFHSGVYTCSMYY